MCMRLPCEPLGSPIQGRTEMPLQVMPTSLGRLLKRSNAVPPTTRQLHADTLQGLSLLHSPAMAVCSDSIQAPQVRPT